MVEIFQISIHNEICHRPENLKMVSFIAQNPSFSSKMMYILGKKCCDTPADFGQISSLAGVWRGLNFGQGLGTWSITGHSLLGCRYPSFLTILKTGNFLKIVLFVSVVCISLREHYPPLQNKMGQHLLSIGGIN